MYYPMFHWNVIQLIKLWGQLPLLILEDGTVLYNGDIVITSDADGRGCKLLVTTEDFRFLVRNIECGKKITRIGNVDEQPELLEKYFGSIPCLL